jgi:hypothetical protein
MLKVGDQNVSAFGLQFSTPKVGDWEPSALGFQLSMPKNEI